MDVIFLDVDNVLNNVYTKDRVKGYRGIDDKKVKILKKLIDETGAKIVLSSTWRLEQGSDNPFRRRLEEALRNEGLHIFDATPDYFWNERAGEIMGWLDLYDGIDHIVILDDEDFFWAKYGLDKYWVNTGYGNCCERKGNIRMKGLTEKHVKYILDNYESFRYRSRRDA